MNKPFNLVDALSLKPVTIVNNSDFPVGKELFFISAQIEEDNRVSLRFESKDETRMFLSDVNGKYFNDTSTIHLEMAPVKVKKTFYLNFNKSNNAGQLSASPYTSPELAYASYPGYSETRVATAVPVEIEVEEQS